MTFCYSPWTNIDFSPDGGISPCCKFRTGYYKEHFNVQDNTVEQYTQSNFLKEIKQQFSNGTWPMGCDRCRIEEENNIKSKRELDIVRWGSHYQQHPLTESNFITASIAFGNTCNLKCITCNPWSSSKWRDEYRDIYGVTVENKRFYKGNFVQDFVAAAPDIIHIDIPGGEPFLSGVAEQKQLLHYYITSGQAHNIALHYTTNATVFPDHEWWDLWQHFQEIDLQLSIDGVGARNEYIRYPAVWSEVAHNVQLYVAKQTGNFRLSVSHTVSAYNIFYLDEFFTWCYTSGLPTPWLGCVHTPVHMRPSVWPNAAKNKIISHLESSSWPEVKIWAGLLANSDDSEHFEKFQQRLHQHDNYRQLDFARTFTELASYI
jgi:hypothetical protein